MRHELSVCACMHLRSQCALNLQTRTHTHYGLYQSCTAFVYICTHPFSRTPEKHVSFDQKDQGYQLQRGQSWKQSFHSCTRTVRQGICEGDHTPPSPLPHTHTKIAAWTLSAKKVLTDRYAYHLSDCIDVFVYSHVHLCSR